MYISGLRNCLRRFECDGSCAASQRWRIVKGGYDLNWQLSYDGTPVVDCVSQIGSGGKMQNNCLDEKDFQKVAKVIKEEYPDILV